LNGCTISASDLATLDANVRTSKGPRFYEPFLQLPDNKLYPLPIKITNKQGSKGASDTEVRRIVVGALV
jgi:hypothetical protein